MSPSGLGSRLADAARALLLGTLVAGGLGCEPGDDFDQPGADDPTARPWAKAGAWYPATPGALDDAVAELLDEVDVGAPRPAVAALPPHAGLRYSGPTAAEVWARVELPDTVLILAPDHFGDGEPAAIWTDGPWLVPGHAIEIDYALAQRVQEALPQLRPDRDAFAHHETELILPWLQYLRPEVRIVPIALFDNENHEFPDWSRSKIEAWGEALAQVLEDEAAAGRRVLLVGTTDLVHHVPLSVSEVHDAAVMDFVTQLDVAGLFDYVRDEEVTICGEIPTAIMMATLAAMGHDSMELLALGNSLHVDPDETDVIGYPAAALFGP